MPIYEYKCCDCGSRFDKRQGFNDEPVATCPECRSKAQRVFRPVPIIFKGSGFYVTDCKGKNPGSAETPASESTPKKDSKGESAATASH